MVAHVLQLPQVVRGDQHRRPLLRHVLQQNAPDLTAHHRVQAVHRLVQDHQFRLQAHGQPEGRLFLLSLAELTHQLLRVQREGLAQGLKTLHREVRVHVPIESHHIPDRSLAVIKDLIGDIGDAALDGGVFIDLLAADADLTRVLPVNAGQVADQGGLARAVGPHQAVDRSLRRMQIQAVQGPEPVKALAEPANVNHGFCLL